MEREREKKRTEGKYWLTATTDIGGNFITMHFARKSILFYNSFGTQKKNTVRNKKRIYGK